MNRLFILIFSVAMTFNVGCSKADVTDNSNNGNNSGNNNGNNNGGGGGGSDNNDRTTFYISSSLGNDNSSGSQSNPWKTLSKISSREFEAGDTLFFKKGDTFSGRFVVKGSGSEDKPIVFTSYGSGNKPILTGSGSSISGGDFQEAIYVNNEDNLVFQDLEIQRFKFIVP